MIQIIPNIFLEKISKIYLLDNKNFFISKTTDLS